MSNLDELLRDLQIATVECLLARVQSGEATASELSVARQLLKDNGIDEPAGSNSGISQLSVVMPFEDPDSPISQVN